jgi:nanoRNase/pAp phosphatase (c-di-AMP/oligoRNAs hydrolase)
MNGNSGKYRLITRSDFDGLVCAILLKEMNILDTISFVHPKDVQDGKVEVTSRDILTNLPYVPGCHLCFDHHESEELRNGHSEAKNYVLEPTADSASRVLYNYFGGIKRFGNINTEMMNAVDKADSARFTRDEILSPSGWVLLSFLMDPRTGLGRFREFRVSNYELMMALIDYCRSHTADEVLKLPDVMERVDLYNAHRDRFFEQLRRCSTVRGNVVVVDLRNEETIYCGNRFVIYALYPECNVSVHFLWGLKKQNTVLAIGKSILNRTNPVNIGELVLGYGGGGHVAAGTCQISHQDAERVLGEVVGKLQGKPAGLGSVASSYATPMTSVAGSSAR